MPVLQVNKGYFGISRRLVTHVKIQCGQCDEARKKENKAPIRPMIVTRALQKMEVTHLRLELQSAFVLGFQIDLIDLHNTPSGKFKYIMQGKDDFTKWTVLEALQHKSGERFANILDSRLFRSC
jgi:hypothetical protein